MAEYLHFVCVPHGKKLLTKSSAIKEAQKGMFAFQQPYTHFLLQQWVLHPHGPIHVQPKFLKKQTMQVVLVKEMLVSESRGITDILLQDKLAFFVGFGADC